MEPAGAERHRRAAREESERARANQPPLPHEKFVDENKIPFQIDRHMSISKDTLKAIIIIVISLAVLVVLLVVANHLRPHP